MDRVLEQSNNLLRHLLFISLLLPLTQAATGWNVSNGTITIFNDGSALPFCLKTASGTQVENCGNAWEEIEWAVVIQRGSNPKSRYFLGVAPVSYTIDSDNSTFVNVTFNRSIVGGHQFVVQYNLSKDDKMLSITPNFTVGSGLISNSYAWFEWHTKNIRVADNTDSDVVWYNDARIDLSLNTTDNLGNSSPGHALTILDEEAEKVIYLNWQNGANVSLNVQPQPGWYNRQLNLSFFLGMAYSKISYSLPFKWLDADPVCSDDNPIIEFTSCTMNATNGSTEASVLFTAISRKYDASAVCTYFLRHRLGNADYTEYTANYPTGTATRTVAKGAGSSVSVTNLTIVWRPTIGGINSSSTAFFMSRINSGNVFCPAASSVLNYTALDTVVPNNSTINTTDMTNFSDKFAIYVFGADNTHIKSYMLFSNSTEAAPNWRMIAYVNSTASRVANRSFGYNFTNIEAPDGCWVFGVGVLDSNNNLNMSANKTFCKIPGADVVAGVVKRIPEYISEEEDDELFPPTTEALNFGIMENFIFLGFIIGGSAVGGVLMKKKEEEEEDGWSDEDEEWEDVDDEQ